MPIVDASALTPEQHEAQSLKLKARRDVPGWPRLKYFNSGPCARHAPELNPLCQQCGIELRAHQKVGALWMFLAMAGLLSDTVGSGKTAQVIAMLAMCKESGGLSYDNRAVIVCKPAAVHDPWADQFARLAPGIDVLAADGDPAERLAGYMGRWEVAVVSDRTFSPSGGQLRPRPGDVETLCSLGIVGTLIYDDTDAMRTAGTQCAKAINRLAGQCARVHGVHATPLQKRLIELYRFLVAVGVVARLGSENRVRQRFVTQTRKYIWLPDPTDKSGRRKVRRPIYVDSGIKPERMAEFRDAIRPLVLRRTAADLTDVALPAIQVNPVVLDLLPAQRRRYDMLRRGVIGRLQDGGKISYTQAKAVFTHGQQICGGLAALDQGANADRSVKLDWVVNALTGDLSEEKVVCFVYHKGNVRALSQRLRALGIGHVLMWSEQTDRRVRARRLHLFRDDPRYRVLIGTTTIEASLNLQTARHLIAVDTILNPARMEQLVGRVRRQGSAYPMVFFHHLLARDTQEDGYLELLRREQAVADIVWEESSDIFSALTPERLLRLVAFGSAAAAA